MLAIPAGILVLYPLSLAREIDLDDWQFNAGLAATHIAAGYLWARSLTRRAGFAAEKRAWWFAGIGYAAAFLGGLYMLRVIGFDASQLRFPIRLTQPVDYLAIFLCWLSLVTGGTGLALGVGLRNLRTASVLMGWGIVVGSASFLLVTLGLGAAGFQIGGVHPPRPTMLPVTFLGVWAAAVACSATYGVILSRSARVRAKAEQLSAPDN